MKKFTVTLQRQFEVDIEAESMELAQALAKQVQAQFPPNSTKILSLVAADYVERPCPGCAEDGPIKPKPPGPSGGTPHKGGTPGAGTATMPVLVDQIAAAA